VGETAEVPLEPEPDDEDDDEPEQRTALLRVERMDGRRIDRVTLTVRPEPGGDR
jgi:hypothetical protein